MGTAWPEPVERVSSFLREAGAEARIEEFAEETPTAEDAAAAAGCSLEQIVKSLVLVCDERPVVALVPGDRRGDQRKIAEAAGAAKARVASPEEVLAATGFTPGAVAPFPLPRVDTVLIERSLLQHPLVWVGGGSQRYLVSLAPTELARLTRARPADLVKPRPYDSGQPKES
ncbi:MAG TPA: YbaK/EbsC family protein [Gaiellaceae bacterium]|nr:YbaK/EbsC family protein [Gaiellaceae bacterium]